MEWLVAGGAALAGLGFSLRYTWWRPKKPGIPILAYHHVTEGLNRAGLSKLRVTPKNFGRQLDMLNRLGYQSVTLSAALSPRCPPKPVVITFDDGYADFFDQAWPRLRSRGMTATVFLVTGLLDGYNEWDREKGEPQEMMLSRSLVRELAGRGVEFGGHSHTHQDLTRLNSKGLMREVVGCQKVLTDILGQPARVFSYPYGIYNQRVIESVHQAGFTAACTIQPGMLHRGVDHKLLPRIAIKRNDGRLDLHLKLSRTRSTL
jgi:peptidoglycan/xylan/chitin deacetylase (PgdA/CDA1 family)